VIWIPETVRSASALAAYINDYLLRQGVLDASVDVDCVEALSHSLSVYLESNADRAAIFVEDGNLLLLASQALRSVGQHRASRRMLMLGSGFARPVSWAVTSEGAGWTLDVARIDPSAHGGLEILFFRCLHAALEALVESWDPAEAAVGVVVLRGAEQAGAAVLGQPVRSRPVQAFVAEVQAACRARLELLARRHGWASPPQLFTSNLVDKPRSRR